jgi:hypothetical protein
MMAKRMGVWIDVISVSFNLVLRSGVSVAAVLAQASV